jgi:hypothetical protein
MSLHTDLIDSIIEMPGEFADVATQGPVEGILVLFGVLFIAPSVLYFGYLVAGAVVDLVIPESFGETHP